jgi:putative endonuclease
LTADGLGRGAARRSPAAMPEPDAAPATDAWVYLLRCCDGSLYTGWTVDVARRLIRHQAGTASRYTASRRPVTLALALPMRDRTAARREEARIKRLTRAEKLALVRAGAPIPAP